VKAVMYHYVREPDERLPHQRFLHVEDFRCQLDWFAREHGFVERDAFERSLTTGDPTPGIVLTFDDALADHMTFVLPELGARGLWGIFYVPTEPYRTGRLLPVHRLHHLLARFSGTDLLDRTLGLLDDSMLSHFHVEEFHTETYGRVDDDAATDRFKRTLNYFVAEAYRDEVIDALVASFGVDEAEVAHDYYVAPAGLRQMASCGMVIGSHSDGHRVLSTLADDEQRRDIEVSLGVLQEICGVPVETFCHPFGGFHSFNAVTEQLLAEAGIRYAFNVEGRDVSAGDLRGRPMALPRYDCNAFPFGTAHRSSADEERR
jgi:peptidoglycan/xylan/chitin deacetylase (PgdA/CDA1 family)